MGQSLVSLVFGMELILQLPLVRQMQLLHPLMLLTGDFEARLTHIK